MAEEQSTETLVKSEWSFSPINKPRPGLSGHEVQLLSLDDRPTVRQGQNHEYLGGILNRVTHNVMELGSKDLRRPCYLWLPLYLERPLEEPKGSPSST